MLRCSTVSQSDGPASEPARQITKLTAALCLPHRPSAEGATAAFRPALVHHGPGQHQELPGLLLLIPSAPVCSHLLPLKSLFCPQNSDKTAGLMDEAGLKGISGAEALRH